MLDEKVIVDPFSISAPITHSAVEPVYDSNPLWTVVAIGLGMSLN